MSDQGVLAADGSQVPAGGSPPAVPMDRPRHRRGLPLTVHLAWIVALAAAIEFVTGRFGFNPTDQGFTLSLSWRLLNGQVPHRDVISARPLGSALLHVVDFALPGPLFLSSGLLTCLELVVTCVALAVLVTGRPLGTWGPLLACLAAAAVLVNINTVPIMAWHTTDGLFCTVTGWWALDSGLRTGRALPRRLGLVLLGVAAITKQSFAPDPLIAVAMLAWHPSVRRHGRLRRRPMTVVLDLVCLVLGPLAYGGWVVAAGGLPDAIQQLTGAGAAYDQRLVMFWLAPTQGGPAAVGARHDMLAAAAGLVVLVVVRLLARRLGALGRVLDLLVVLGVVAMVVKTIVNGRLGDSTDWGIALFWIATGAAVVDGVTRRRMPWRAVLVLLAAAMCTLSWGADSPTELAGSLALTAVFLLVRGMPAMTWAAWDRRPVALVAGALAGLIVLGLTGRYVLGQRDLTPYRDRPTVALTADLGSAVPALEGIRGNRSMLTYLRQIRSCLAGHPADRVAILPDNPFAYPALKLHNPFPNDWPLPPELVGNGHARMLAAARTLDKTGDYLVLFQTVGWATIADAKPIPARVGPDTPVFGYDDLSAELETALTGQRTTCGSFVGVWAPKR